MDAGPCASRSCGGSVLDVSPRPFRGSLERIGRAGSPRSLAAEQAKNVRCSGDASSLRSCALPVRGGASTVGAQHAGGGGEEPECRRRA